MYGHIGASTEFRRYPTVANVREQLYTIYEADDDALPGEGALPTVQDSTFRYLRESCSKSCKLCYVLDNANYALIGMPCLLITFLIEFKWLRKLSF